MPDLNLPIAEMLPTGYVQSEAMRLEIYGRVARCRSEDDLDDLEEETARRFGRLPPEARDFFAVARLRLDCKRRGIVEAGRRARGRCCDVPARPAAQIQKSRSLQRDGDRVVCAARGHAEPFGRIEEFLELLDE